MKKYRIVGNTSGHEFKIGSIVRHAKKFDWSSHDEWYTTDGAYDHTWGVKKADLKEIVPIHTRIIAFIKGVFKK